MTSDTKPILQALSGKSLTRPPVWLMRQAGRYLPEYRACRAEAGGFLDLCYDPDFATEVTLQPIRRFGFDAAILFADILLVPHALGADLTFEAGEGPRLSTIETMADLDRLKPANEIHETLSPIYETVRRLSSELPKETTLIGFAGSPWTVATYMIAGRGTPDQEPARRLRLQQPELFFRLIDLIVDSTVEYLSRQVEAGAEVVKLFDSWAGSLSWTDFGLCCVEPNMRIVKALKARFPSLPIIGFPRGAGERALSFVKETGVEGIAIDQHADPEWARDWLQPYATVQGNLDPILLVHGGDGIDDAASRLMETLGGGPYIFNLGHGITPQADTANVDRLLRVLRG